MVTADELGLSQAEFEAAMNLENMYALVKKSDCTDCGKTPVTHADTKGWKLLCNACGKKCGASKISITNFKTSEIEQFQRHRVPTPPRHPRAPSPQKAPRDRSPWSRDYGEYARPSKRSTNKKKKRHRSPSTSYASYSSDSTSSEPVKKKSKKRREKKETPAPAYYDPVNPPSAFAGSDHQFSGMNAIKMQEQNVMMQQQRGPPASYHTTPQPVPPLAPSPALQPWNPPGPSQYPSPSQPYGTYGMDARLPYHMVSPPRALVDPSYRPHQQPALPAPVHPGSVMTTPPANRVQSSWSQPPMMHPQSNQFSTGYRADMPSSYASVTPPRYAHPLPAPSTYANPFQSNPTRHLATNNPFQQCQTIMPSYGQVSKYPWKNQETAASTGPMIPAPTTYGSYPNGVGMSYGGQPRSWGI